MRSVFSGARTVTDVALKDPTMDLDLLLVSGAYGLAFILQTMGFMRIPFLRALRLGAFPSSTQLSLRFLAAAAFLSLLLPPAASLHQLRYLAVVFIPLVVLTSSASRCSEVSASHGCRLLAADAAVESAPVPGAPGSLALDALRMSAGRTAHCGQTKKNPAAAGF